MEPLPGTWWRSDRAPGLVFRYIGRTVDGAYRFARYGEQDREAVLAEIEIWNLDSMKPVDE